jgi:hypothetical protein
MPPAEASRGANRIMATRRRRLALMAALVITALVSGASGIGGAPVGVAEAAVAGTGGTTVTISGANFTATTTAMFGWSGQQVVIPTGTKCATGATGCLVSQTATSLAVKAPAEIGGGPAFGFQPITVCTNGANAATCEASAVPGIAKVNGFPGFVSGFVYGAAITKMAPLAGAAGTSITLTGAKFGATEMPTITFLDALTFNPVLTFGGPGATKCTTTQRGCVKSFGDTSIVIVAPDGLPAARYIVDVMTATGPATALVPPFFSYGPAVLSSSPVGGPGGATLTIKGTNFGTGTPATVRFIGIGPGGSDVDVTATCTTGQIGCFTSAHTKDTITLKAPAADPTGFPMAHLQVFISGVPADDMTPSPITYGQSGLVFHYGPVVAGSTGLLFAKPGTALTIKGANFGALAGVQLGNSTVVVKKCSTAVTHTCIVSLSDTAISVKPPPTLSGEHMVSVVSARLVPAGPSIWAETLWAHGGFQMSWSTTPVVTNIS